MNSKIFFFSILLLVLTGCYKWHPVSTGINAEFSIHKDDTDVLVGDYKANSRLVLSPSTIKASYTHRLKAVDGLAHSMSEGTQMTIFFPLFFLIGGTFDLLGTTFITLPQAPFLADYEVKISQEKLIFFYLKIGNFEISIDEKGRFHMPPDMATSLLKSHTYTIVTNMGEVKGELSSSYSLSPKTR